ncbi:Glutamate receptor-interacting protein 1 [Taenia crassiceps]|uniref:Glutamate receptor-interacting protein 1 n=1 Tax=Taenia crassiceps TaxID=6207 RepID=A0ABR4QIE5_9CEST
MSFGQTKPQTPGSGTQSTGIQCRPENLLSVCVHLEQRSSNNMASTDSELVESCSSGTMYGSIEVTLHKQKYASLGITVSGGIDRGYPPRITTIKPGSIADRSDCILVNDVIKSINGAATANYTHEQIVKLTKNADATIRLELEYALADFVKAATTKHAFIHLEPVNESFGITVRGGLSPAGSGAFPLIICRIRPRSCADLNGCLKQGDRILAIDGVQTNGLTCEESMKLLACYRSGISLFIEYDVADVGAYGRQGAGPFEIEIEKLPSERLGANVVTFGDPLQGTKRLLISHIRDGSIADRCGALQVGDLIESINGLKASELTLQEATDLLSDSTSRSVKLHILPCPEISPTASLSPAVVYGAGLCRTEEVEVVLEATPSQSLGGEPRRRTGGHPTSAFGFSLRPPSPQTRHDEPLTNFPLIANVIPGGPAFQSGVIQAGDSLLAIQGDSPLGKTIDKLTARYLSPPTDTVNRRLALVTQYTVAENVIPTSGVFDVRIIKRSASLGINLQASRKSRPGEPLLISKVIPGSVASRCGSISPGDILLAVNGVSLEACSITDAARLLQTSDDIVTLRIQKPDEEAATPLSDEDLLSCCQSDLEIVRDDDNDFGSGGGGGADANNEIQDDEFLSQSADESISHLLPPPRMPRQYRSQKPKRTQHRRVGTVPMALKMQQQFQQLESEMGSDRRGNPSDSFSSDRFSENMCSDTLFEVHKVRLIRSHPSCPWGVVISGTDDVIDAPVYIDSLTAGKPAALSGLLRAGDRILAVNGLDGAAPKLAGGSGLTLSLVTARLQQPSEQVTLYIAREKSRSDFAIHGQGNSDATMKQYPWGTSCSQATEFNQSFDEERVRPSPRAQALPSTTRLRKQNSASKIAYPRHFTAPLGFGINPSRESGSGYFDDYGANFPPPIHCKAQGVGRSTGDLLDVPRQTVDAYLSKDEAAPHHQHHRHHKGRQQHSRRRKNEVSRHQRRHKQEADVEESEQKVVEEDRMPRASSTLNLEDIACPGCREAVVNEVLNQQRLLSEQRCDRSHVTRRRGHLKMRGRSLEIVDSKTAEGANTRMAFASHRIHRHHHHHQVLEGGESAIGGSYHNLSRSDSRLNRERLDPEDGGVKTEEVGSISSLTVATATAGADISASTCTSLSTPSRSIAFSASQSSWSSSISSGDLLGTCKPTSGSHRTFAVPSLPSNGKQRSHRSTEVLPRGNPTAAESRNTTPIIPNRRLHRSASRENRLPSWRGWIRLVKPNPTDSFGIGLSKGLSSRGIYVSAIRPGSIADTSGLLQIYDRILKVNETSTKGRTCREVVALIRRSSPVLDLFVYRRR